MANVLVRGEWLWPIKISRMVSGAPVAEIDAARAVNPFLERASFIRETSGSFSFAEAVFIFGNFARSALEIIA